jgi:hypothetical protein
MNSTALPNRIEDFFKNQINQHCRLPRIGAQDAFDLWHSATELVRAISDLERLIPKLNSRQVERLVESLSHRVNVDPEFASAVVRRIDGHHKANEGRRRISRIGNAMA